MIRQQPPSTALRQPPACNHVQCMVMMSTALHAARVGNESRAAQLNNGLSCMDSLDDRHGIQRTVGPHVKRVGLSQPYGFQYRSVRIYKLKNSLLNDRRCRTRWDQHVPGLAGAELYLTCCSWTCAVSELSMQPYCAGITSNERPMSTCTALWSPLQRTFTPWLSVTTWKLVTTRPCLSLQREHDPAIFSQVKLLSHTCLSSSTV